MFPTAPLLPPAKLALPLSDACSKGRPPEGCLLQFRRGNLLVRAHSVLLEAWPLLPPRLVVVELGENAMRTR